MLLKFNAHWYLVAQPISVVDEIDIQIPQGGYLKIQQSLLLIITEDQLCGIKIGNYLKVV